MSALSTHHLALPGVGAGRRAWASSLQKEFGWELKGGAALVSLHPKKGGSRRPGPAIPPCAAGRATLKMAPPLRPPPHPRWLRKSPAPPSLPWPCGGSFRFRGGSGVGTAQRQDGGGRGGSLLEARRPRPAPAGLPAAGEGPGVALRPTAGWGGPSGEAWCEGLRPSWGDGG